MISSSPRRPIPSKGTTPDSTLAARSRIDAVLAPESPAPRSCSSGAASTASGVGWPSKIAGMEAASASRSEAASSSILGHIRPGLSVIIIPLLSVTACCSFVRVWGMSIAIR